MCEFAPAQVDSSKQPEVRARPQELLFVFGLNWGVMGAALAPAIGQYVGLAVMVWLLVREKALFAGDLGHVPTLQEVTPLLQVCHIEHLSCRCMLGHDDADCSGDAGPCGACFCGCSCCTLSQQMESHTTACCHSIWAAILTGVLHSAPEQKGLPLGAVNLLVLPVVVGCTSLVTALGVTALAAHTIIKQVWDFWTQVSQCLNIAANSMVASALGEVRRPFSKVHPLIHSSIPLAWPSSSSSGEQSALQVSFVPATMSVTMQKDLSTARDVLLRIMLMGFAPGVVLGAVFLVAQSAIPAVFTQDPGVISAVTHIVPLLALAMVRALCMVARLSMPSLYLSASACAKSAHDTALKLHALFSWYGGSHGSQSVLLYVQPLIPMATVLEGALLGAVDTSYIAKRTGLGIAIALAVIYGALVARFACLPWSEVHAVDECRNVPHDMLHFRVPTMVIFALGCRQSERAAHGPARHLGGAGKLPV